MTICEEIFIYPTDTVWGIGANIFSENSYNIICKIKRISPKPMSIMFAEISSIKKMFDLPSEMSANWLRKFFSLESSLAIPKDWSFQTLPPWITQDSSLVSIRCLENFGMEKVIDRAGGPVLSTSLNITGGNPIFKKKEAKKFQENIEVKTVMFETIQTLSGNSSTIVRFADMEYSFIREGNYTNEIKKHMELLTT